MKRVLIGAALIGLALIVIAALGLIFFLNPIVAGLKPTIVQTISQAVNAPVEIGKVTASIFPTTSVEISDLRIGDGARLETLGAETTLSELLRGTLGVQSLSLRNGNVTIIKTPDGKVSVAGISLEKKNEPQKTFERPGEKIGEKTDDKRPLELRIDKVNFENLALTLRDQSHSSPLELQVTDLSGSVNHIGGTSPLDVSVSASVLGTQPKNLELSGSVLPSSLMSSSPQLQGKISLAHINLTKVAEIERALGLGVAKLNMSGELTKSASFQAVPGGIQIKGQTDASQAKIEFAEIFQKEAGVPLKISAEGTVQLPGALDLHPVHIVLGSAEITASYTSAAGKSAFTLASSNLDLTEVSKFVLPARAFGLSGTVTADIKAGSTLTDMAGAVTFNNVSAKTPSTAVENLTGKLSLDHDTVTTNGLQLAVLGQKVVVDGSAKLQPERWTLNPTKIQAFGGVAALTGAMEKTGTHALSSTIKATRLDLKQLSSLTPNAKFKLRGTLSDLSANINGASDSLSTSAGGNFSFAAEKGAIEGVNIFGQALKKLDILPGVSEQIALLVPEQFRPLVDSDATEFENLDAGGSFANGKALSLSQFSLRHALYQIVGKGTLVLGGDMNIKAQLQLTKLLADSMLKRQPKLKYLLDRNGSLIIPVVISRTDGKTLVIPDASELGKNAARNAATDAAGKALDKIAPGLGGASKVLDSLFK